MKEPAATVRELPCGCTIEHRKKATWRVSVAVCPTHFVGMDVVQRGRWPGYKPAPHQRNGRKPKPPVMADLATVVEALGAGGAGDPERLTDEDFAAVIGELEEAAPADGPVDLGRLAEATLREFARRLEDPDTAAEMPDHVLHRAAQFFADRRSRGIDKPPEEPVPASAVEVVNHPGLPVERRRELLMEIRAVAVRDVAELDEAIEGLEAA